MKVFANLLFLALVLSTNTVSAEIAPPTLAGLCKKKAIKAAQGVVVIDSIIDFNDSDIEADSEAKNIYGFNYAQTDGDTCFYRAWVTIKPTKIDKNKNQILECEIIKAEDDGEPNCG